MSSVIQNINIAIKTLKLKEPKWMFRPYVNMLREVRDDTTLTEQIRQLKARDLIQNICFIDISQHHPDALQKEEGDGASHITF